MRRGRRSQRGAEALEFIGTLPLLAIVIVMAWQGIVLARQKTQAETDARTIARAAVLCPTVTVPALLTVDPGAAGGRVDVVRRDGDPLLRVVVTVRLEPRSVLSSVDLSKLGISTVSATVTMRQEPCA